MVKEKYYYSTGRRKTAVARVKLYTEAGTVVVNGRPLEEISEGTFISKVVTEPFDVTKTAGQFRVMAKVSGGGFSSQSEAIRHGIARALTLFDPELRKPLKKAGLLTRSFFGKYFCFGFAAAIFIYVAVNMSMVLGLLPIVGSPLPIMSYGGSSMMATMIGLSIVMSSRIYHKEIIT